MAKEEQIRELREKIAQWLEENAYPLGDLDGDQTYDEWKDESVEVFLTLIKSVCYLKADGELPRNPYCEIPEGNDRSVPMESPQEFAYKEAQQDMLTPDPEGRVWASVYKEW